MRVLVLGAGGFLGARLAARLAAQGRIGQQMVEELVLFDLRPTTAPAGATCPVVPVHGDLRDRALMDTLFVRRPQVIFHLAATLTVEAETDVRRGLETNVLAFIDLLERCRQQEAAPMLLFASSIATFGGQLPAVVSEAVPQSPTTSYGSHKVIAEQLLADYSRRGFVDGRAWRLPIVVTHPGPASGSISDQVASLIREPLRGQSTTCRMEPDTPLVVASVDQVVRAFLGLAELAPAAVQACRTMNLPGLSTTPAQIVQAVARQSPGAAGRVGWRHDPQVQRIVAGWPQAFTSSHAVARELCAPETADALVASFLASEPGRA